MRLKKKTGRRVDDVFGQSWDVSEWRGTRHGFDVVLGFPAHQKRGMGGVGRARVVLTEELARHLTRFRMNPAEVNLPFSPSVLRRLRG